MGPTANDCLQISDPMGEATAKMNIADLKRVLNLPDSPEAADEVPPMKTPVKPDTSRERLQRVRRESMEQLSLIKVVAFVFCVLRSNWRDFQIYHTYSS